MTLFNLPLIRYTLKATFRDRLVWIMIVALVLSISLSIFMASAAVTEKDAFAAVFLAGSLRIFIVLGMVLFTCFHIRRLFDNREIEYLLSSPISRPSFITSVSFSISLSALIFVVLSGAALFSISFQAGSTDYLIWAGSFAIELLIMVNAALFFSMVISSAAGSALATFGFYVLGRMMGQLIGIAEHGIDLYGITYLRLIMDVVSMCMPRLDLLTQSSWLVYGVSDVKELSIMLIHGALFVPLLLTAAIFDLVRREF